MSEQQELALGRSAHSATLQQYPAYANAALEQYVDAVGARLAAQVERRDISYTFTVVDSNEVNAFALPGGYVYVTRGLLAQLNSEAELAAVLGHELGHISARHGVRQASSAQVTRLSVGVLSIFFPAAREAGLDRTLGMLASAFARGYGREHELEADRLGANYLAAADYTPRAMQDVLTTLKAHAELERQRAAAAGRDARPYHGLFATHPDHDKRLAEIIAHVTSEQATAGEVGRDRYLDRIDGLPYGEDADAGACNAALCILPGAELTLTRPDGWEADTRGAEMVLIAPSKKQAVHIKQSAGRDTLAKLLEAAGVTSWHAGESFQVGGFPAVTGLTTVARDNAAIPVRVTAVATASNGYVLTAMAAPPTASTDATFKRLVHGIAPLTTAEREHFRPRRLTVVTLSHATPWGNLAARATERELAVMNRSAQAGPGRVKLVQ
jgi:predicted Zn-dependent protease